MKHRWILLLAALALVLAACGSGDDEGSGTTGAAGTDAPGADTTAGGGDATEAPESTEAPPTEPTGMLTIALDTPMDQLDPAAQNSTVVMMRLMHIVESLTWQDAEGVVQPLLATEWESAADGMSWTFKLREGVTFHDGTPFNADAVKFSIDRVLDPDTEGAQSGTFRHITETRVIDDYTVEFVLAQPYPILDRVLSQPMGGIVSPASVEVAPNTMEHIVEPVGTGPYMFDSYSPDEHLTLAVNRDYWGEQGYFDTQVWRIVPDASSRVAMLQTGEADIIWNPPADTLETLSADDSVTVSGPLYPGTLLINLNTQSENQPLLQNAEVRKALSHAIDPNVLIDRLLAGAAIPADGPVPSSMFGDCDAGHYEYDPDLARQMLADNGADGMSVTLWVPNGRYLNDFTVGEAIAGQLREVGVDVTIEPPTDFATYLATVWAPPEERPENIDMLMIGSGAVMLDAGKALFNYHTASFPPTGYNGSFHDNPEFDALLDQSDATIDPEQRAEELCDLQEMLVDAAPAIWMYTPAFPVAMRSDLTGTVEIPLGYLFTSWVRPAS